MKIRDGSLVFISRTGDDTKVVGRLYPDGTWDGEQQTFDIVQAQLDIRKINLLDFQAIERLFSGSYLWAKISDGTF